MTSARSAAAHATTSPPSMPAAPRHGLEPERQRRCPRPGRVGLDRLRRRRVQLYRRPAARQHRRPRARAPAPRPPGTPAPPTTSMRSPSPARSSTPAGSSPASAARTATTSPPSTRRPAPPLPGTPVRTARSSPSCRLGSVVYAGGTFSSAGGQNRSDIAALDASTGAATAWDPSANGEVLTPRRLGFDRLRRRRLHRHRREDRHHIAALNAGSGAATAWNPARTARSRPSPCPARPSTPAVPSPPWARRAASASPP